MAASDLNKQKYKTKVYRYTYVEGFSPFVDHFLFHPKSGDLKNRFISQMRGIEIDWDDNIFSSENFMIKQYFKKWLFHENTIFD